MITIYGDSCARELFKAAMRVVVGSSDPRYLPRMNESEPNREAWGRQFDPRILTLPASHPLRHFCFWRGCGVGYNLERCGMADRVVDGDISYASKAYIDTAGRPRFQPPPHARRYHPISRSA